MYDQYRLPLYSSDVIVAIPLAIALLHKLISLLIKIVPGDCFRVCKQQLSILSSALRTSIRWMQSSVAF